MRTGLATCAMLLAFAAHLPATQDTETKKGQDKPVIVVEGCVDGSWLEVHKVDAVGNYAQRYKLRGSKQLLKEIARDYDGHLLEVTGAVTDSRSTTHRGKTIQVGKKTRIHTGAKEVPGIPSGDDASMDVQSFRELKKSCH
jgi:hypothetical protein